jgi:hypothetical protein
MSPGEVAGRTADSVRKVRWRSRKSWDAPMPDVRRVMRWERPAGIDASGDEANALIEEARRCLAGDYKLLNVEFHENPIDWHRDPVSGLRVPLTFGPDIDYRDAGRVGSAKNVWEKSRHHHLTIAALAYALSGEPSFAQYVAGQLQSWVRDNPVQQGINWASPLELGVRLIAWVWIDRLLRGSDAHERLFGKDGTLWPSIYWHQWVLSRHRSHGSSANNHLIGEAAGLMIAATAWPVFDESGSWERLGRTVLEREIVRQTFPSGLNRELGFDYHIFVLEFFLLAGVEAANAGRDMSVGYRDLLRRMLEVILPLCDFGGNCPHFGDEDDGRAVQLQPDTTSRIAWLFRVGRAWLGARVPEPAGASGQLAAAFAWPGKASPPVSDPVLPSGSVALEDAGVYVLSSNRATPGEMFCVCDAGPLGFLSIAAHGHADALAFTLSVGGRPVIVDAGTYVYHADRAWRDYFRGTAAHNTITIDGADQSQPGGIFLWTRKAQTRVLAWEPTEAGGKLVARHDGYTRLPGRPVHRRSIELSDRRLEIADEIQGEGTHEIDWRLHFHPSCKVLVNASQCAVEWSGGRMGLALDAKLRWHVEVGGTRAGWFSPAFNQKVPSATLIGSTRAPLPFRCTVAAEVE